MKEKFSYFDILAYFIPGIVFLWVILIVTKSLGTSDLTSILKTGNAVIDSLVFVALAFISGHLIQYRSQAKTEKKIKEKYWGGNFVSELFLLKGSNLCSEKKRCKYIKLAKENLNFSGEEIKPLEKPEDPEAKKVSHSIYRRTLSLISDQKIGVKAEIANTYYNFFRGLSTACFYYSILLAFAYITSCVHHYYTPNFSWNIFFKGEYLILILMAVFFGYATYGFMERARQRGEHHVREVFDSMTAHFSKSENNS